MHILYIVLTIIFSDMPNAVVRQDSTITHLLEQKVSGQEVVSREVDGYRVQVYSSNRQQEAKAEALQLEKKLLERLSEKVYVQYAPPFWKVRIGDYRTLDDANAAKEEIISRFPQLQSTTYVVRDKIVIRE